MPKMTGSRCLAQTIYQYDVSHVFIVPAVFFSTLLDLQDLGVKPIMAHSELSAAYMADGYARARRRPSVCFAQAVGAANLAAGLRDAHLAHAPVVSLTGGPAVQTRHRHVYQEIEDLPMFDPICKFNLRVESVERLPDLLRQAFREATTGTPGPVHLEIPGRLGESLDIEAELEVIAEERFTRLPPYRPAPEPEAVEQAAAALAQAERPVLVAGGGIVASDAAQEFIELAETLSIPVAVSLNGKEVITEDHPLNLGLMGTYGRWATNQTVAEADLVFFVGSSMGGHVTDNWKLPRPGTTVLQLDVEPSELGRNYPLEVGIMGDVKVSLGQLLDAVTPVSERPDWLPRVRELQRAWWEEASALTHSEAAPLRPERICHEVSEVLPDDGVVVVDTGHSAIWAGTTVRLTQPEQRFIRCAGTLGWAFPGAMGVQCALPERKVICITGDGGMYYHMAEFETAARNDIHTVTVVINNNSFRQTKGDWEAAEEGGAQRARPLWVFGETDFARIAESMGCLGIRVEDPGQLRGALETALNADRPALIDVICDIDAAPIPAWKDVETLRSAFGH